MTSKRSITVKSLSGNLLQMKFMKKTALASSQACEDEDVSKNDAEHWVIDPELAKRSSKNEQSIQPSHAMCEDLAYGRMSFKGFNPAIEKIMKAMKGAEESDEEMVSAEDQQFAEQYASVTNVAEKFMTKKHKLKYRDNSRSKIGRFASVKKMKLSDEGT